MEGHGDKTKELKDLLFYLDIVKYLSIAKNPTFSGYQYHTVPKLRLSPISYQSFPLCHKKIQLFMHYPMYYLIDMSSQ